MGMEEVEWTAAVPGCGEQEFDDVADRYGVSAGSDF